MKTKHRNPTLNTEHSLKSEMFKLAEEKYPDFQISGYFNLETGKYRKQSWAGDTLALFIGNEINSLYDPAFTKIDYANSMAESLATAIHELDRVREAFELYVNRERLKKV